LLPFLKPAVMCPVFQSEGNWFNLYETSNNILEGVLVRVVTRTVCVDECYQGLEILWALDYLTFQKWYAFKNEETLTYHRRSQVCFR